MRPFKIDIMPAEYKALKDSPVFTYILIGYIILSILASSLAYFLLSSENSNLVSKRNIEREISKKNQKNLQKYRIQDNETRALVHKANQVKAIFSNKGIPWYHLINELEKSGVPNVFIKDFTQKDNGFTLHCFTIELESAISFYKNILKSKLFKNVSYGEISKGKLYSNEGNYFSLKFSITDGFRKI